MGKKKSETRKHTGMLRIESATLDRLRIAASLLGMSVADYATDALKKASDRDIAREIKKLSPGGGGES